MAQQKVADLPPADMTGEFDELQPGVKLLNGQYTITRFLNNGGFGITYLAKDSLNRNVVLKECFLSAFCRRSKTIVVARSRAHQSELRSVVQLFIREAHNLAKLVHPNIVAVHQVFEDNGTAYMAIDYIDGQDLLDVIEDGLIKFTPDEVVRMTEKLLSAVKFIHDSSMLHRDISPDNVLISRSGEPILIDFGAAREQTGPKPRAMTAMRVVKDGYSPQEFYIAGSEQGPWSDLYALAATLYHLISGTAPANGQARLAEIAENRPDSYLPLAGRFAGYPKGYLEAIDKAMNSVPKMRLQAAAEWLAAFRNPDVLQIYPERHAALQPQVLAEPAAAWAADVRDQPRGPVVPTRPGADRGKAGVELGQTAQPAVAATAKSPILMLAGVAAAIVVAGVGFVMFGGAVGNPVAPAVVPALVVEAGAAPAVDIAKPKADIAVPEVAPEIPAAQSVETVAVAALAPEVAAEVVPEVVPEATPEPAAQPALDVAPDVAPDLAADPIAAPEVAAVPQVAPAPLVVPVSAQQISFAAWDIRMPFAETNRIVGGKPAIVVSRVTPSVDGSDSGNWLQPGLIITAINDQPLQKGATVAGLILGDLKVDPDGFARVVVHYTDAAGAPQTGLLAAQAVRRVSLANGVSLVAEVQGGRWKTTVQSVEAGSVTSLQPGDVIFREKATGTAIDGAQSVEALLPVLVEQKLGTTELAVIRGSKVETAFMQLAIDPVKLGD